MFSHEFPIWRGREEEVRALLATPLLSNYQLIFISYHALRRFLFLGVGGWTSYWGWTSNIWQNNKRIIYWKSHLSRRRSINGVAVSQRNTNLKMKKGKSVLKWVWVVRQLRRSHWQQQHMLGVQRKVVVAVMMLHRKSQKSFNTTHTAGKKGILWCVCGSKPNMLTLFRVLWYMAFDTWRYWKGRAVPSQVAVL